MRIHRVVLPVTFLLVVHAVAAAQWTPGPDLPNGRANGQLVKVADGSMVAIGGDLGAADATVVHGLSRDGTAWSTLSNLDSPRLGLGAVAGQYGTVLQFGGQEQDNYLTDTVSYDPGQGNINSLAPMSYGRADFGSAWDALGRAYAFGGYDGGGYLSVAERYDPGSGQWSVLAPMPAGCSFCSAAWDGKDSIFVFTGTAGGLSVLRYTISTNAWTAAAAEPVVLSGSTAVLGGDGLIYLLGGAGYQGPVATVQRYDPQADTWAMGTSLPTALSSVQAAVDASGRIVVTGGYDSTGSPSVQTWFSPVLHEVNAAPTITSTPPPGARVAVPYGYALRASGYPSPTYTLVTPPAGMTISGGVISWTPSPAEVGTYTIQVHAANSVGSTTQSYSVAVLPPPPPVPTGLAGKANSSVSITLTWQPVSYGFSPLTYKVYEYFVGGGRVRHGSWAQIGTSSTTSFALNGLTGGTGGSFSVASSSPGGTSALAPSVGVVTPLPATPVSVSVSGVTAHTATLTWVPGKSVDPTVSYAVYDQNVRFVTGGVTGTHVTLSNLTPSTSYYFYVFAYDAYGSRSGFSPAAYVTTPAH